jgi:predicted RNase H-like HicB family nuclease
MKNRTFTAIVQREGDGWVSLCPDLDVASQGDTIEQARENLREAVELLLECASAAEIQQRLHTETYLTSLEVTFDWTAEAVGPGSHGDSWSV